jgi:hypothetical protein
MALHRRRRLSPAEELPGARQRHRGLRRRAVLHRARYPPPRRPVGSASGLRQARSVHLERPEDGPWVSPVRVGARVRRGRVLQPEQLQQEFDWLDRTKELFDSYKQALGRSGNLEQADLQKIGQAIQTAIAVDDTGLCTIPDDREAVREAYRVLRPGGRFLLLEHVRSPRVPVLLVQRLLDPLAVRFAPDHLLREPLDHLAAAGFEIERLERMKGGMVERIAARKPRDNRRDVEHGS